jgi:hypothetical protein
MEGEGRGAEVKALVERALDDTGALAKLKAQVREAVGSVAQQQRPGSAPGSAEQRALERAQSTEEGQLALALASDLLHRLGLTVASRVLHAEASVPSRSFHDVALSLGLNASSRSSEEPLLMLAVDALCNQSDEAKEERHRKAAPNPSADVTASPREKANGGTAAHDGTDGFEHTPSQKQRPHSKPQGSADDSADDSADEEYKDDQSSDVVEDEELAELDEAEDPSVVDLEEEEEVGISTLEREAQQAEAESLGDYVHKEGDN